jgi:hypothetical protein
VNNRLLELAQEAEQSANLGNAIDVKLMMQNYAELIVKECIRLCDEIEDDYLKGEDRNTDIGVGAGTCAYEIEKHFGVE